MARIETEKLLIKLVDADLATRRARGEYSGKFAGLSHYFGYEGRCSLPSDFDATYVGWRALSPSSTIICLHASTLNVYVCQPCLLGTAMRWVMALLRSWSTTPRA